MDELNVVVPATEESLNAVKYQDLLATFTKLGVPEAWKGGEAKEKMIKKALEKLALIKKLVQEGNKEEDIPAILVAREEKKKTVVEGLKETASNMVEQVKEALSSKDNEENTDEAKEEAVKEAPKDTSVQDKIEAMNLTKVQLESSLNNINVNLKKGIPTHREILVAKKNAIETLLAQGKYSKPVEESTD